MINNDKKYMLSVDCVNEGIAIFRYKHKGDKEAYLEYANSALCNLLHVSLEQLMGLEYSVVLTSVHPEDVEELKAMVHLLPQTITGDSTYRIKDKITNEIKWLTAHGQFMKDEKGHLACFAFSDISKQIDAMEREQRLAKCIQLITDSNNFSANIEEMMNCLCAQYQADRAYIFEFDWENYIMHNRVEVTAENVSPEIDELQNLPIDIVKYWIPKFKKGSAVFIENLENIKDDETRKEEYDVLVVQDIVSLMVVPVGKNKDLYGYVGVDNPHVHFGDKKFLNSIAAILAQEYQNRAQQRKLREISLCDALTMINNRHAYNYRLERLETSHSTSIGIIFTDVNGLKYVNDQYGHREGDDLIIRAVEVLEKYFRKEDLYRISGDEFVALVENISKEDFCDRVKKMKMDVSTKYGAILSIGESWHKGALKIEKMIQRAEKLMYDDKKAFYEKFPEKNRRR